MYKMFLEILIKANSSLWLSRYSRGISCYETKFPDYLIPCFESFVKGALLKEKMILYTNQSTFHCTATPVH